MLSASEDGNLKLWDLKEGRLLYKVMGHKEVPAACAFAPSGRSFASGDRDGLVFTWDCSGASASAAVPELQATKTQTADMVGPNRMSSTATSSAAASRRPPAPTRRLRSASAGPATRPTGSTKRTDRGSAATRNGSPCTFVPWPRASPDPPSSLAAPASVKEAEAPCAAPAEPENGRPQADGLDVLSAPVVQTLRAMQGHLEMVARTVQLLERRLAMTEEQVGDIRKKLFQQPAVAEEGC